ATAPEAAAAESPAAAAAPGAEAARGAEAYVWGGPSSDFPYRGPIVPVPDLGPDPLDEHGTPSQFDEADGWQFNREPDAAAVRPEPAAAAAQPDAFNAESRVAVWRDAFAPLSPQTEPCPGWRLDEWARVYACIKQFLAGPHAFTAPRTGWSAPDLFGVQQPGGVPPRDPVGPLTANTTNGFVVRVEADGALQFANGTKAKKRPLDSNV